MKRAGRAVSPKVAGRMASKLPLLAVTSVTPHYSRDIFLAGASHYCLYLGWVLSPEDMMISFLTALTVSFLTLCLGTYVADRVEAHSAAAEHDGH
jgi:hypothetical protein